MSPYDKTLPDDLVFVIEAEDEEQAMALAAMLLLCDSDEEAAAMAEDLTNQMRKHFKH